MHLRQILIIFVVTSLYMVGCGQDETVIDESVKEGEARSVFVRNYSGMPMTFRVEINGVLYETIHLQDEHSVIYYEPLFVGLSREQVEDYKIDGKITDNFGRTRKERGIEYSLDIGRSEVYPYHPSGWNNSSLYPSYGYREPLTEWLSRINAVARKVKGLDSIEVFASPIENAE